MARSDVPGFRHERARVNDTELHYVIGGHGPAVVLLHGWPYTWVEWRKVMPILRSAGFTVVAPDLRGFGDSGKPDSGYLKRDVAEDVHRLVGQLGLSTINLYGTDIGMMVAYAYAAQHPQEVRRLVLGESVLPGFGLEELMNPATGGYWHFGFHMQVELASMLTAGKEDAYLSPNWEMFAPVGGVDPGLKAELLESYTAPGGMRGGFQHYGTLLEDGRANREQLGEKLAMPVLVLNGDHGIPQDQTVAGIRQVAGDVTAELVPDSGHAISEENPAWLGERLTRFFG